MNRPGLLRVFGSLTDQVLSVGAVFLANIVLARSLSTSAYGVFTLVYSIYTLQSGFHNGLVLEAFTVFGSGRYREVFDGYWRYAFRLNLAVCAALAAVLLLVAAGFAVTGWGEAARTFLVLTAASPVFLSSLFLRRVLYVENRAVLAGAIAVMFFVTTSLLLALVVWNEWISGTAILLVLATGWIIASPLFFWGRSRAAASPSFGKAHPRYLSEHWRYSKWVVLTAVIFQLTSQGYFWLAAGLMDTAAVGELRAGWNLVQPAVIVFSSFSALALPWLSRLHRSTSDPRNRISSALGRYAIAVTAVAAAFAALAWTFGDVAYALIYRHQYDASLHVFQVMALLPFAAGVAGVFSDALRALERPGMIFYAYVAGGLLTLLAGIPAIARFGVAGAAWGMVASNAAYALTLGGCYFWLRRRYEVEIR